MRHMTRVTLLFPSTQAFKLWCRAMHILRKNSTLHLNGQQLGRYHPTQDGMLAEINIAKQE